MCWRMLSINTIVDVPRFTARNLPAAICRMDAAHGIARAKRKKLWRRAISGGVQF